MLQELNAGFYGRLWKLIKHAIYTRKKTNTTLEIIDLFTSSASATNTLLQTGNREIISVKAKIQKTTLF